MKMRITNHRKVSHVAARIYLVFYAFSSGASKKRSDRLRGTHGFRQLPRIKIPVTRVLSYPFQALVLARLPKSLGGDDERTEGTAHCHHQRRGREIDRGQEKGVSSSSGFGLPQRQCSARRHRVRLVS